MKARAVEELHENSYWQWFCGFKHFQRGQILDATTLVKFRDRIGFEDMHKIEAAAVWNMCKVNRLHAVKQAKSAQRKIKCAA
jgi:IS5 family transposase